ncbi:MAG: putative LPS assembly protein LptD, partial [Bacteroidia bacterium]|nr:putative LPS assembly protein LptD [Bacteroidia bacterium]
MYRRPLFFLFWIFHSWVIVSLQAQVVKEDSLLTDSVRTRTILLDSLKKESPLQSNIKYDAKDSIVFDVENRKLYLYGEANLSYENMSLTAAKIWIDWKQNLVYAQGIPDSNGKMVQTPVFKEGGDVYYTEKMTYNFQTKKGKIWYAKTNQNGDIVAAEQIRRNPDNTYFLRDGFFTTCNADEPHFCIKSKKMKVIPGDKVISGPLFMVIEGVPIPIVLPFGFFPNRPGRRSGILLPTYGELPTRGFFFQNMGFYLGISDYWDLTLRGDIYTKGGYRLEAATNYNKKYRFSGNLRASYSVQTNNERTDPDYFSRQDFFVSWQHQQSITPNMRISSNVNAGSSSFLRNNSYNANDFLTNTLRSTVTFSWTIPRSNWSIAGGATADQNLTAKTTSLQLPNLSFNRARTNPFRRRELVGKERWYEKIGYSYSSQLQNSINAPDSILFKPESAKLWQSGFVHNLGLSTNLKFLKYITISPSVTYNEYWFLKSVEKEYQRLVKSTDTGFVYKDTVITNELQGFASARDIAFSVNANTTLYGILQLKSKRQWAIRHTMRPTIGYNVRPDYTADLFGFYKSVKLDSFGNEQIYSRLEQTYAPRPQKAQAIQFSLSNLLEMKFLSRSSLQSDTAKKEYKKITLLDNV